MKNKKSFFTPPFLIQGDRKEPKTFILLIYPRISAKSASGVTIGGDEFLVLCLGIEEKDLREHVEKLRMDMKEHQVTMAVGMIWKERGPKDIDLLLNESERLMYEDKDRYYKEHGLKRRR